MTTEANPVGGRPRTGGVASIRRIDPRTGQSRLRDANPLGPPRRVDGGSTGRAGLTDVDDLNVAGRVS